MSVATQHSPFAVGTKRLFESEENEDRLQRLDSTAASHKRYRARGSPNDRCAGDQAQAAYRVSHATLTALRGLFPEMSDKVRRLRRLGCSNCFVWAGLFGMQPALPHLLSIPAPPSASPPHCLQVIADVLAEYGDNIDAAIKHLTDLRLSAAALGGATPQQAAAAVEQQQQQVQQQQEQQAQVTAQQAGGAEAAAGPSAAAAATANGGPRSADEWVDAVVAEMAAASDMADARARASKVLQAFEQAAVEHSKQLVRSLLHWVGQGVWLAGSGRMVI